MNELTPGIEKLLTGIARMQAGETAKTLLGEAEASPDIIMTASSVLRIKEIQAFNHGMGEDEAVMSVMAMTGPVNRRRVMSHLARSGVINHETPLFRLMNPGTYPSLKSIIRGTAQMNGRPASELTGDSKRAETIMARFEAAWIAIRIFGFPIVSVSEELNRTHPTIISGLNKTDIMIMRSPVRLDRLLSASDDMDHEAVMRYANMITDGNIMKRGAVPPSDPNKDQFGISS